MKVHKLLIVLAAVASFGLTSCGDSHEAVMGDLNGAMEEFSGIVGSVKTADDAKAAVPKIKELTASVNKLAERIKALGPPDDLASLAKGGMGMGADPAANLMAIANPNLPQEFRDAATEFTGAHMKVMIAFAGSIDFSKMIPN